MPPSTLVHNAMSFSTSNSRESIVDGMEVRLDIVAVRWPVIRFIKVCPSKGCYVHH